jgi:hypothetical protein
VARTERRAREFAQRVRQNGPTVSLPRGARGAGGARGPKQERWEDDDRREGRTLARVSDVPRGANVQGMEGGADEELDFDENEAFQDDDDVNTFYHNPEDEDEAKLQDVSWSTSRRADPRKTSKSSTASPTPTSATGRRSKTSSTRSASCLAGPRARTRSCPSSCAVVSSLPACLTRPMM